MPQAENNGGGWGGWVRYDDVRSMEEAKARLSSLIVAHGKSEVVLMVDLQAAMDGGEKWDKARVRLGIRE